MSQSPTGQEIERLIQLLARLPGLGPSRLDIPVTANNREVLRDLFGENVERWKPA